MAYQRVDKKNPKIVPKCNLEGFSYKRTEDREKMLVMINDASAVIIDSGIDEYDAQFINVEKDDIPKLVCALWAAYAVIEKDQQSGDL